MADLRLTPSEEFKNTARLSDLFQVLAILSLLFLLFYFLFIFFSPYIHHTELIDKNLINPWLRSWIPQNEGRELPVMFIGSFIYLALAYLLLANRTSFSWFSNKIVQLLCILPTLVILSMTNPPYLLKFIPSPVFNVSVIVLLAIFLYLIYRFYKSAAFDRLGWVFLVFLWLAFGFLVILSASPSDPRDYGFYIGPALKLIQGEKLGSFYMQYDLALTYLFKLMMDLGFRLSQMELVLRIIIILWFALYYKLASKLIRDSYLVFLFMISLVIVRFLSLIADPVFNPQGSPFRLELWVPLLLVVFKFGFFSPITAVAFSLGFVFNNLFGFFYLGSYIAMLIFLSFINRANQELIDLRKLASLAAPIIISFVFQLYYFRSLFLPAATMHQDLRLTFMPISPQSMFWIVAAILPVYLYLLLKEVSIKQQITNLFLLILALLQLVYFYGRSHEHNILMVSGILLLILFLCFDKLIKLKLSKNFIVYVIASLIIILPSLGFAKFTLTKLDLARVHLSRLVLFETHPIDVAIDNTPGLFSDYSSNQKIFLMSNHDSYINYRFGFKQLGYFSPFVANIYLDDTAKFLVDMLNEGYKVVLWEKDMIYSVSEFNKSNYLKDRKLRFDLIRRDPILELTLIKADDSQKSR